MTVTLQTMEGDWEPPDGLHVATIVGGNPVIGHIVHRLHNIAHPTIVSTQQLMTDEVRLVVLHVGSLFVVHRMFAIMLLFVFIIFLRCEHFLYGFHLRWSHQCLIVKT